MRLNLTCSEATHTLHRWRRTQKPACGEHNIRTFLTWGTLLVEVGSSCLCPCTNDWYSPLAGIHLCAPHPAFLKESIRQHIKQLQWGNDRLRQIILEGTSNSNLGRSQTSTKRSTTSSSRSLRETFCRPRLYSFFKQKLAVFSKTISTRLRARICSSSMAANFGRLGAMYSSCH